MFDRFQFRIRKWQWQFDREPKFRRGLGFGLIAIFMIVMLLLLGLHVAGQIIHDTLSEKLKEFSIKNEMQTDIGKIEVGLFSVGLDFLSIKDTSNELHLKDIDFGWRLTFDGPQIDAIGIKESEADINAEVALSRLIGFLPLLKAQEGEESPLFRKAGKLLAPDTRFTMKNGKWKVRYQHQELSFAGVAAEASLKSTRQVQFQANSISIGSHKLFSKSTGKISIDENRDLHLTFSNAAGDKLNISADRFLTALELQGNLVSSSRFLMLVNGFIPGQFAAQNIGFDLKFKKVGPEDYTGRLETKIGTVTVANEKVTNLPFDLFDLVFKGSFKIDGSQNLMHFEDAILEIPPIEAEEPAPLNLPLQLSFDLAENFLPIGVTLGVENFQAKCQKIIDILPRDAIPMIKDFRFEGNVAVDLGLKLDIKKRSIQEHTFKYKEFNCQSEKYADAFSKKNLESTLTVTRHPRNGESFEIIVGPENPFFAPYSAISPNFIKSLIASEDAGFYGHHGFDLSALEDAFERNVNDGEFAVGGSTITMQTIKNLYLGSQKNILRKLQEIFLAAHVETMISKQRILEIYSNLAEFGPNIFGIGEAAKIYFAKTPKNLTLKESVFLVSLLPSPVVRFRQYCGNRISFAYKNLMDIVVERMARLGRIDYATMNAVNSQNLAFNPDPVEREKRCFLNQRSAEGLQPVKSEKNLEL